MSKLVTDGVTGVAAAVANKFIAGDSETAGNYMALAYRIYWDGAAFVVSQYYGSRQSYSNVTATWVGTAGTYYCHIDLSGLTNPFAYAPCALATAEGASTHTTPRYIPQARCNSQTEVIVRFIDNAATAAGTNAYVTATDAKMAFNLILLGQIE